MTTVQPPSFCKIWWIASRPFSFPASAMSVVFGTAMAATVGEASVSWGYFGLALIGMVALHAAANIWNDVHDFQRGIDREVFPVSGAVVRCYITPAQGRRGAALLAGLGAAIGLYLASQVGWPILLIGLLGVGMGYIYSLKTDGLKYHALGDLAVFLSFGVLGVLGAWTLQTGSLSFLPVLWSVPLSFFIIGILHANNWRDSASDRAGGFETVASLLGDYGSLYYYGLLVFAPFVLVLLYMTVPFGAYPRMPLSFLLVFAALPSAIRLMRKACSRHSPKQASDFVGLDGATAQLNLMFGVLSVIALLSSHLFRSCP